MADTSVPARSDRPRLALVTGGNRGLGRAIVESLAGAGCDIVLTYRSHEEEAKEVVEAVHSLGRQAVALELDTTLPGTFAAFAGRLRDIAGEQFGREDFDVLVNNAGFAFATPLGGVDEAAMDQLFSVHVKGVYLLTQALAVAAGDAAPLLADGGRIVNLSSGLTRFVTPSYGVYAAMKGAVEVLTRFWAVELGARNISVNCVAPGPVDTDFAGAYLRADDQAQQFISGMTALGRVATAKDIGPIVAAVVGRDTGWITGERIEASGGFSF